MPIRWRLWTADEEKALTDWLEKDSVNRRVICESLNRTWCSVEKKIRRLGHSVPFLHSKDSVGKVDLSGLDREGKKTLIAEDRETRKILEEKDKELKRLRTQLVDLNKRKNIYVHNLYDKRVKIGVVSDTHMGSLYSRQDVLDAAYECFEREGAKSVYVPGDISCGEKMYRGQEYEVAVHGADAQSDHIIANYPRKDGITTYFITGNHDLSFWKNSGTDIGKKIDEAREDMVYLGKEAADIFLGKGDRKVILRILHPGKGTAYALSYHPQKYIESLSGGQKPHIVLMGHYHKAEMIPCYRNVFLIQSGCVESQTPFMARNNIAAHVGYWILEFTVDIPHLISRFKAEFFAVYEETSVGRGLF